MSLVELSAHIERQLMGEDVQINGLTADSRQVEPGYLFAAVSGGHYAGERFISDAIEKGAVAIITDHEVPDLSISQLVVKNTRKSLAAVAMKFFENPAEKVRSIAVTGTNGKTTCAHLIGSQLERSGIKTGLIGTLGAQLGDWSTKTGYTTPDAVTLAELYVDMIGRGAGAIVIEASSHALEQSRVHSVSFDCGLFTNLTPEHLDYHGDMGAYFDAKNILFSECLKDDGVAVIPLNVDWRQKIGTSNILTYSFEPNAKADVALELVTYERGKTILKLRLGGTMCPVSMPLVGRFNVENAVASAAVSYALSLEVDAIAEGLMMADPVAGRFEQINLTGHPLVIVDYAHTPDALENLLEAAREITKGKLVCVFGCGGDRDVEKRPVMGAISTRLSDFVIVTSDNPRSERPDAIVDAIVAGMKNDKGKMEFHIELDRRKAIEKAICETDQDGCVVIAGKGHEDYQIIGKEVTYFDDRVCAREILRALEEV
ncbi:MAG: UDP-N-acetylmuramoyl-L-alanyl-D-glutamate--2,6-diaminopimelate ligase [Myxococcota bacterium]|nr:UDP-N-acetylmuramoyl-L-alanyl-D-glutamate--2,6-diaminopimelate ligase [Myxococcota bacterium]